MSDNDANEELTWQCATDSAVWLQRRDQLGRVVDFQVQGKGTRFRISRGDYTRLTELNPHENPFVNGMLLPVEEGKAVSPRKNEDLLIAENSVAVLPEELEPFLKMRQPRLGRELEGLPEVQLTQLRDMLTEDSSNSVVSAVEDEFKRRFQGEQQEDHEMISGLGGGR